MSGTSTWSSRRARRRLEPPTLALCTSRLRRASLTLRCWWRWRRGGVVATPWDVAAGGRRLRDARRCRASCTRRRAPSARSRCPSAPWRPGRSPPRLRHLPAPPRFRARPLYLRARHALLGAAAAGLAVRRPQPNRLRRHAPLPAVRRSPLADDRALVLRVLRPRRARRRRRRPRACARWRGGQGRARRRRRRRRRHRPPPPRLAVWNCASLPNAVVAIVAFAVPDDLFIAEWPWLLPVALLVAKLLLAQALKEVAAASGVDRGARAALRALGE